VNGRLYGKCSLKTLVARKGGHGLSGDIFEQDRPTSNLTLLAVNLRHNLSSWGWRELAPQKDNAMEQTTEYLKCILTEAEIKEAGAALARRYSEITNLEEQKKSVTSDFKAKIDAATAEASLLARQIQNGYEFRQIDCEIQRVWEDKTVQTIRLDTGEIVKTRPMTADELQDRLAFNEQS